MGIFTLTSATTRITAPFAVTRPAVMTLPEHVAALIDVAKQASARAYCPYSRFPVGAALVTASGEVFCGCNIENASYGLAICAERNATFHMVAAGHRRMAAIVVYTATPHPTAPCGACRQVLYEFGRDMQIACVCDSQEVLSKTLSELLPAAFPDVALEY